MRDIMTVSKHITFLKSSIDFLKKMNCNSILNCQKTNIGCFHLCLVIYIDLGKNRVLQSIGANYHPKNEDKILKEFNAIIKFIYENNYTKFENLKSNYYPEF